MFSSNVTANVDMLQGNDSERSSSASVDESGKKRNYLSYSVSDRHVAVTAIKFCSEPLGIDFFLLTERGKEILYIYIFFFVVKYTVHERFKI